MNPVRTERVFSATPRTNPVEATVRWSPAKSLWYFVHLAGGVAALFVFPAKEGLLLGGALTAITLCCGHTVGLHRLLIHRNLVCPLWLERLLVYLGTLVGMGGPFAMIRMHDIRDWAQRHPECHPFYIHQAGLLRDWWWNLHCRADLAHPPRLRIEDERRNDPFYRFLERTWMLQQIPPAVLLWFCGGWGLVLWGVSGRIVLSLTGHWLIGHFAHNGGKRTWHLSGHAVQGYNLPFLGVLTMGECWHNNHHAFPESARLGFAGQSDPGWWFVLLLERAGIAEDVRRPEDLADRVERKKLP